MFISHKRVTYPANTLLVILRWKKGPEPLSPMATLFSTTLCWSLWSWLSWTTTKSVCCLEIHSSILSESDMSLESTLPLIRDMIWDVSRIESNLQEWLLSMPFEQCSWCVELKEVVRATTYLLIVRSTSWLARSTIPFYSLEYAVAKECSIVKSSWTSSL